MTRVILIAVVVREAAVAIKIASFLDRLSAHATTLDGGDQLDRYVWAFVLHAVSQIIAGFGMVATIEFLARTYAALRAERLSGAAT